jgi:hypothetical protein
VDHGVPSTRIAAPHRATDRSLESTA